MTHREATLADLDPLTEWNRHLIADESSANPMTEPELRERMRDWLITDSYRVFIFTGNEADLAYALFAESDTEIFLRQFFVHRDHRRQGHGRQAMHLLKSEIWPRNKRLTVEVLAHNTAAYTFWRSIGYEAWTIGMSQPAGSQDPSTD
jgi:predicted acetyltransferase